MNQSFNLLFYVKKTKINSQGEAPIYLRINIDGRVTEISVKRTAKPQLWNSAGQKLNGNSEAIKSFNFYLKTFEQRVYDAYHELMKDKDLITCESLKNKLLGTEIKIRMLIPIFQDQTADKI